jgi:hypothetical protein
MSCRFVFAFLVVAVAAPGQIETALIPSSKDNTLYQSTTGALSNGSGQGLFAGRTGQGADRRGLIAFDVAGTIPSGSSIQSAELQLTMDMTVVGGVPISLHTVSQDWGEGTSVAGGFGGFTQGGGNGAPATTGDATWLHTFFNTSSWTNSGGDFSNTASATTTVNQGGRYIWSSAQALSDVQGWLNSPSTNFGWLLKAPNSVVPGAKRFRTRESPVVGDRPLLIVTFSPPAGAAIVSSGYGCPVSFGSNGFSLSISTLPVIGSPFTVVTANGHAGGLVAFYLASGMSASPVLLPGSTCPVWLDVPSALAQIAAGGSPIGPLPLDATGGFSLLINVPNVPSLVGVEFSAQATSTGTSGVITSNAIWFQIG